MPITRTVDQHHKTWRDVSFLGPDVTSEDEAIATARDLILNSYRTAEGMDPLTLESLERSVLGIHRCEDTGDIIGLFLTSPRRAGDGTRTEEEKCDDHHWVTDFQHLTEEVGE